MSEISALLDRLQQMHDRDRARVLWHEGRTDLKTARRGLAFEPGDRVVDLTTGETVEVLDGKRLNIVL